MVPTNNKYCQNLPELRFFALQNAFFVYITLKMFRSNLEAKLAAHKIIL